MKTAEEWRSQMDLPNIREVVCLPWEKFIKAIQLDAERSGYERGVREAAKTTSHWLEGNRLHPDIPNERLSEPARMAAHSALQQAATSIIALLTTKPKDKPL